MSKAAKVIGKNSLIAAIALDLLGILLSCFIDANLTNEVFLKVVLFCYCIRFELIVALILLVLLFLFSRFLKSSKEGNPTLSIVMVVLILVAIAFSIRPAKQYIIARYYYFNNQLYKDESQKRFLDNAQNYMDNNEWDLCIQNLTKADALYSDSYYSIEIYMAKKEANMLIEYGERLHDEYIRPFKSEIPLNSFKCAQTLSGLYPSKYKSEYLVLRDSVMMAINTYPQLYKAFSSEDYKKCRELILKYGWCWFEPTVYGRLSYDNETKVMEWLNQYLETEELYDAQSRMVKNWFGEDSVSTIIQ